MADAKKREINVPVYTRDTFLAMLFYLYADRLPDSVADPAALLTCADEYGLPRLVTLAAGTKGFFFCCFSEASNDRALCSFDSCVTSHAYSELLSRRLTPDTLISTYALADSHHCLPLTEFSLYTMRVNWHAVYSKRRVGPSLI